MSQERKLLHTSTLRVRWGDMDAVGHVNNARYFTYLEQVRIDWLASMGLAASVNGDDCGPVIANASCNFRRAIVFPAELIVRMYGGAPGRSSFETWYEIRDAGDQQLLYADGASRMVWVDHRAQRSIPVPDAVRALLPAAT